MNERSSTPPPHEARGRLAVLCYHNVESTWFTTYPDGPRVLRKQFEVLARYANVVRLGDALTTLAEGGRLPRRAVSITFDDGYRDNLEVAAPILEELGLPATFFLVPGFLDRSSSPWWERLAWALRSATVPSVSWRGERIETPVDAGLAVTSTVDCLGDELKTMNDADRAHEVDALCAACVAGKMPDVNDLMLDWDGARELVRRGFEIGSHSHAHTILRNETGADVSTDLRTSKDDLESRLGAPIRLLAYPNGRADDFDEVTVAAARAAGYSHAVTTVSGWNTARTGPFEVARFVTEPINGARGLLAPLRWDLSRRVRRLFSTGKR